MERCKIQSLEVVVTYSKLGPVILLFMLGLAMPAFGAPGEDAGGRYQMSPVEDGFVRLDTETGAMSLCTRASGSWSCRPMAEDQGTSGNEVARLRQENRELEEDLRRMEETFGLDDRNKRQRDFDDDPLKRPDRPPEIQLPDEKQVDQAIDYLEGMIRKFRKRFEEFGDKTNPRNDPDPSDNEETPL